MPDHAYLADGTRAGIRPHRRVGGAAFVPLARPRPPFPHPWLTLPTTDEAYEGFIGQLGREGRRGFLVCVRETGALAGFININNIVRGAFQCGAIGYGAFPPTAGRGYMSEGLGLVLRQGFPPAVGAVCGGGWGWGRARPGARGGSPGSRSTPSPTRRRRPRSSGARVSGW